VVLIYFKTLIWGDKKLTRISRRFPLPVKLVIFMDIELIL